MPTASARPEKLLEYSTATRQRSLSLAGHAATLTDALDHLPALCPGRLSLIPPLGAHVGRLLAKEKELATFVEDVARHFLKADGNAAVRIAGGSWAVVPAVAAGQRPGAVGALDADALTKLATWLIGEGEWAWRHRGTILNLIGAHLPVAALRAGAPVSGKLLTRVAGELAPEAGVVLAGLLLGIDAWSAGRQGNPVRAFQERGSNYLADSYQVVLDLAGGAFAVAPGPVTGGIVLLVAAMWAGLTTADERRRFANRVVDEADQLQDEARDALVDLERNGTSWVREVFDIDVGGRPSPFLPPVTFPPAGASKAADVVLDGIDAATEAADEQVDDFLDRVRAGVHGADAGFDKVVDAGLDVGAEAWDVVKPVCDAVVPLCRVVK